MNPGAAPDLRALGSAVPKAIAALLSRAVALQIVVLCGNIALVRLLDPSDFGVFVIVSAALEMLVFLGNTGIGGALVRQADDPSERQLSSVFFFQLAVAAGTLAVIAALAGFAPLIWRDLPSSAPLLIRVLALDLLLLCARIVPMLLLERRLEFHKIAVVEVVGSITFQGGAVALAASGAGVWALVAGVLMRGAATTIVVFRLCGWRPRVMFSWDALRPLIRFGVTQQSRTALGMINGAAAPVWGGRMLGTTGLGYVNWAERTAYFSLELVEVMCRVGFPVFARLRQDRALMGEAVGRAVHLCAAMALGWSALCLGLGEHITLYIFSAKWGPAVPALYVFAGAITIGFLSPLVGVALDALGRPGVFAWITLGWTIVNWIVVPLTTARWGMLGFALGWAVHVVLGNIAAAVILQRFLPESTPWRRFRGPVVSGVSTAIVCRLLLAPRVAGPATFALALAAGLVLYLATLWIVDGRALLRATSVVPFEPLLPDNPSTLDGTPVNTRERRDLSSLRETLTDGRQERA